MLLIFDDNGQLFYYRNDLLDLCHDLIDVFAKLVYFASQLVYIMSQQFQAFGESLVTGGKAIESLVDGHSAHKITMPITAAAARSKAEPACRR